MKRHRISSLTLALVLALACVACPLASAAPLASDFGIIQPNWINVSKVTLNLSYSSGTATCSAVIDALSGTTSISAVFTLSRKNTDGSYTPLKTWPTVYATGARLTWSDTYSVVTSGNTYKLSVSAQVQRNSVWESVNDWIEVKY